MGHETKEDIKTLKSLRLQLKSNSDNVEVLFKIAMLLCEPFHDIDASIEYFKKSMRLMPNNPEIPFWLGYFLATELFEYEQARDLFKKALSIDPDRAVFNDMMFYVLSELEEDESFALNCLLKAIAKQPDWPSARYKYVSYLAKKHEFEKAKSELDDLRIAIDIRCKNKNFKAINILEHFFFGNDGHFNCKKERQEIELRRRELNKQKATFMKRQR